MDLLDDFTQSMDLKGFSPHTRKTYHTKVTRYIDYCERENIITSSESFKTYLFTLIKEGLISRSSVKQNIAAIKFFLPTPKESLAI